jgi:hypothetical protein
MTLCTVNIGAQSRSHSHFFPFFFAPPFSSTFRFSAPPAPAFTGPFPSFGLEIKNPSSRPCCFAESILASLEAPARIRSSLQTSSVQNWERPITYLKPLSRHRNSTNPSTSGVFHSSCPAINPSPMKYWNSHPDRPP